MEFADALFNYGLEESEAGGSPVRRISGYGFGLQDHNGNAGNLAPPYKDFFALQVAQVTIFFPKGPRTQIMGFQGPNTIILMVFGP